MTKAIQTGLLKVGKLKTVAVPAAILASAIAFGAPPDLAPLTDSLDFTTVIAAVLAVGVALLGIYIAIKGAKTVISMVRGA